jgi:hypothetical protein
MRFKILPPGWAVRDRLLEAGTILDTDNWPADLPAPDKLPLNAQALDDAAYVHLRLIHPWHHHLLQRS